MKNDIKFPSPSDDKGCGAGLFIATIMTLGMIVRHPKRLRDAWRDDADA
jgi:hypothetical protein